jgi:hypothetical protein
VACNDDACGIRSEVTTSVAAGTLYFIRVAGFSTQRGHFAMMLTGPGCIPGDCNANRRLDACDLAAGTSHDCNANQTLDECDIASGASRDCDANAVPDECEVGLSQDCNANGTPDVCDITSGASLDCNSNARPDECDLAGGTSQDCNLNRRPDECDIGAGASADCNGNGTPDDCENGGPPPAAEAQDACGRARQICPGVIYTGNTLSAANDGSAACGSSEEANDVWYRYTPARSGMLTVSLCGSSYDTVLSIHAGCPGTEDNELACVDDACDYQSEVTIAVTEGTVYLFRISGYSGDTGEFTLSLAGPECRLTDCNANGALDACDIAGGTSRDCNANAAPDECDIATSGSSDCDGNGVPDECLGVPSLTFGPGPGGALRLEWSVSPAATGYDVVRGSLQILTAFSGDFTAATQACSADDTSAASLLTPDSPPAGEGYWYLVRGVNCALAGTYDSADPSQVGVRDAEIQAAANACP